MQLILPLSFLTRSLKIFMKIFIKMIFLSCNFHPVFFFTFSQQPRCWKGFKNISLFIHRGHIFLNKNFVEWRKNYTSHWMWENYQQELNMKLLFMHQLYLKWYPFYFNGLKHPQSDKLSQIIYKPENSERGGRFTSVILMFVNCITS